MVMLAGPISRAIEGTPLEGNEVELRRLSKFPVQDQALIVSVIKGGEATTVNGAIESLQEGPRA